MFEMVKPSNVIVRGYCIRVGWGSPILNQRFGRRSVRRRTEKPGISRIILGLARCDCPLAVCCEFIRVTVSNHSQQRADRIYDTCGDSRYSRVNAQQRARELLSRHPHFYGRVDSFEFEWVEEVLVVKGAVPTYYLKQLLQSALRKVEGVRRIDNRVVVVRPERSGG
jgi:hypothetical protein